MLAQTCLKETWKHKLTEWEDSGLSGAEWCREQNITYCIFLYWKKKLGISKATPQHFLELIDHPKEAAGIEIEFQGFLIRLSRNFDEQTFQRCTQILKRL